MRGAAGRQNRRSRTNHSSASQFEGCDVRSVRIKFQNRSAREYLDTSFFYIAYEGIPHRLRFVRKREYALLSFFLRRHVACMEKIEGFAYAPLRERREKKFPTLLEFRKEFLVIQFSVRYVASTTTGREKFFAKPFVFLEQNDRGAHLSGSPGRHHSSGAAADNGHVPQTIRRVLGRYFWSHRAILLSFAWIW